jgi:hypothetical protein
MSIGHRKSCLKICSDVFATKDGTLILRSSAGAIKINFKGTLTSQSMKSLIEEDKTNV